MHALSWGRGEQTEDFRSVNFQVSVFYCQLAFVLFAPNLKIPSQFLRQLLLRATKLSKKVVWQEFSFKTWWFLIQGMQDKKEAVFVFFDICRHLRDEIAHCRRKQSCFCKYEKMNFNLESLSVKVKFDFLRIFVFQINNQGHVYLQTMLINFDLQWPCRLLMNQDAVFVHFSNPWSKYRLRNCWLSKAVENVDSFYSFVDRYVITKH